MGCAFVPFCLRFQKQGPFNKTAVSAHLQVTQVLSQSQFGTRLEVFGLEKEMDSRRDRVQIMQRSFYFLLYYSAISSYLYQK